MSVIKSGYGVALAAAIIVLVLFTAASHLFLGLQVLSFGGGAFGVIFILNGLGYLGLTALLYLPLRALGSYRGVIRYTLLAYTALTVALWIPLGVKNALGYLDKIGELALIALLVVEGRRERR